MKQILNLIDTLQSFLPIRFEDTSFDTVIKERINFKLFNFPLDFESNEKLSFLELNKREIFWTILEGSLDMDQLTRFKDLKKKFCFYKYKLILKYIYSNYKYLKAGAFNQIRVIFFTIITFFFFMEKIEILLELRGYVLLDNEGYILQNKLIKKDDKNYPSTGNYISINYQINIRIKGNFLDKDLLNNENLLPLESFYLKNIKNLSFLIKEKNGKLSSIILEIITSSNLNDWKKIFLAILDFIKILQKAEIENHEGLKELKNTLIELGTIGEKIRVPLTSEMFQM